jgi:predicted acyl esterase
MKSHARFGSQSAFALAFFLLVFSASGRDIPGRTTVMLPIRDGVKLATDIFKPAEPGSYPVILSRTPYNKDNLAGAGLETAKRGFIFVVQDVRGRFASEGPNLPFNFDVPDGFDTVEWIARQPWCNGKIGTWGGSAGAITQFQLMASGTDKIAAQHLVVGAPNLYDVIYINGVFRKAMVEGWLRDSKFSSNALDIWVSHPIYDDYWKARDASRHYAEANWPALHLGGYWDIFAQRTIDSFLGYQKHGGPNARGHQKLVMGPWTHGMLQTKAGELPFPNGNNPPGNSHDAFQWFGKWLKADNNTIADEPAVTYYVIGDTSDPNAPGNVWRTAPDWPPVKTRQTKYYFQADRTLSQSAASAAATLDYTYDPANPAPTIGGIQLTLPAGPRDQRKLENRDDVLVFTTDSLQKPLEVTGNVDAKIWISTDVPDTDFIARLCDVYPDGRSFNLCEGAIRARFREGTDHEVFMQPGKLYPIDLDLWSTSVIFNKGHKIRVQITSSSAPGYDPNPNTGTPFRSNAEQPQKAHIKLYTGGEHSSAILLPVAE